MLKLLFKQDENVQRFAREKEREHYTSSRAYKALHKKQDTKINVFIVEMLRNLKKLISLFCFSHIASVKGPTGQVPCLL